MLGTIDFPLVAKNLYGESGRGVSLLKSRIEFDLYIQGQIAGGLKSPIQLQKFIPGDVFGLNMCAVNGVICAWSAYKKLDGDTLQFLDRFDICELLSGLVKDTKFSGLANFDLIVGKDGIYLLECNPRVWYTIQADRFLGLDFVKVGIANRLSPVEAAKVGRITGTYTFPKKTLKMLINPMTIFGLIIHH